MDAIIIVINMIVIMKYIIYLFLGITHFDIIVLMHFLQQMCSQNINHNPNKFQTADLGGLNNPCSAGWVSG